MPIMRGTLGPYTSASSKPTLWPRRDRATAIFTETVVFPTPPLPDPTAIKFWTPAIGTFGCSACAVLGPITLMLDHRVDVSGRAPFPHGRGSAGRGSVGGVRT